MRRLFHVMLAAGLVAGASCKGTSKKARLVSDAEMAKMRTDHDQRVKAHLAMSCQRPVLRGDATAGSGTQAVHGFADAKKGPHAACLDQMSDWDDISGLLVKCDKGQDRRSCPARPLADTEKRADIDGVLSRCGDTLAALQKAVSHGEVCSPFLPTKGPKDPMLLGYIRASQIAAFQARKLAREGKQVPAMELVFDAVRLMQDVSRPGANLISAMISVAGTNAPMDAAESILNSKIAWKKDDVDALVAQADKLRASQIDWGHTMVGEGLYMLDEMARNMGNGKKAGQGGNSMDLDPTDELGITWIALRANNAVNERECVGKSLKQCAEGTARAQKSEGKALEADISKQLASNPDKIKQQIRKRIVGILRSVAGASMSKYVKRNAESVGALIALRAHLEYVRMTAAENKCPDAKAAVAAMAPMLASKRLGSPMSAFVADDGTIEIRLPSWTVYNDKNGEPNLERLTIWRVRCPK